VVTSLQRYLQLAHLKLAAPNQLEIYRRFTHGGNGNAMDTQGRFYTAERDGHRVVRTNLDGSETVVANLYEGKRLNAPTTWSCGAMDRCISPTLTRRRF